MEFTVPQFIEKEAKIVGPFTFKQFIFIGVAGGLCLFFFYILPFFLFIIVAILLLGGALALCFLKIEKTSLPLFIKNFFAFFFKPKIYFWKKKTAPTKIIREEKKEIKEEPMESSPLKLTRSGKLGDLYNRLETK